MNDQTLTCRDCGQTFVFSRGEQEFFASRGSTSTSARRELFPATCAECGTSTLVPFEPRGDRPVYCSDCFASQRGRPVATGRGGW